MDPSHNSPGLTSSIDTWRNVMGRCCHRLRRLCLRARPGPRQGRGRHTIAPVQQRREDARMLANVLVAVVALLHVYFMTLEMFLWDRPFGRRTFGLTPEFAAQSRALAANQGLYNGFLAAGLAWGLWLGSAGLSVKVFFLVCVLVAGVFGAITVSRKILLVQALPAVAALVALAAG